jgi:hypothetical protein
MEDIQNATLSGGVAIGAACDMILNPGAAVAVSSRTQQGSLAAITQGPPDPIALPVFLAYVHHGNASARAPADYAYAILPGVAAPADAPAAVAAFAARTAVVNGAAGAQAVCRAQPNASTAWALHAVFWPPAAPRAAPAPLRAAAPCPAVLADAPAVVTLSADAAAQRITVAAAAPLRAQAGSALAITLADTRADGPACALTPDGTGTVVTVQLPSGALAGSSAVAQCTLRSGAGAQ